jgi:hypothetical protein
VSLIENDAVHYVGEEEELVSMRMESSVMDDCSSESNTSLTGNLLPESMDRRCIAIHPL